jgi:hypothetical protein
MGVVSYAVIAYPSAFPALTVINAPAIVDFLAMARVDHINDGSSWDIMHVIDFTRHKYLPGYHQHHSRTQRKHRLVVSLITCLWTSSLGLISQLASLLADYLCLPIDSVLKLS